MIQTLAALLAIGLASSPALTATLTVDASHELRTLDRHRLLGSNVAGWYLPQTYNDPVLRGWIKDLGPILLRLPGGSWGDGTFWNGNGVRHGDDVDYGKLDPKPYSDSSALWGTWNIDYSHYAPGFLVDVKPNEHPKMLSTKWHGHVDVKTMHDFVRDLGDEPFVIVNAGTGSPRDAAEWVRWANQTMHYGVRYWEVGNEQGGSWEAGHFLPDGRELDGPTFARRYEEFARAIKAVDPTAKVGCMDWLEDVLKRCSDQLDFFSIHAYPTGIGTGPGAMGDDELYAKLDEARRTMDEARATIRKVRPDRERKIELDVSEWSMGWGDIRGALWHAGWVGEMFRHGAAFAMQWDVFHMVTQDKPGNQRLSIYWPFWLWSRAMGDMLVASELSGANHAAAYATRTDHGMSIMVINQSAWDPVDLDVKLEGFTPGPAGREFRFTPREFFWLDREPGKPEGKRLPETIWNTGPAVRAFKVGATFRASVPPSSIIVYAIPAQGQLPVAEETRDPKPRTPNLALWLPPDLYAGDQVEAWVWAQNGDQATPYPLPLEDGRITCEGPVTADRKTIGLAQAVGHFLLKADQPGPATVTVRSGTWTASRKVEFKPSVPKPRILWDFEEPALPKSVRSQWKMEVDGTIRPNQQVCKVTLEGEIPNSDRQRELLVASDFPPEDKLDRKNIRGALFDIRLSPDFTTQDPAAYVEAVIQSPINWWMPLGRIKLADLVRGEWTTETFLTTDPGQIRAMPKAFDLWITIRSEAPVRGSVDLDRVGLMVR